MDFHIPRLYAILDAAQVTPYPLTQVTETLLKSGVRLIQYRDKQANARQLFTASQEMGERVRKAGGIFIVNDRVDVARAASADGVHLGQDDLPVGMARRILPFDKLIGISTHSPNQVRKADQEPIDYIAFGPIFATRSKERPDPEVGLAGLREARKITRKPLVAIGGITLENASEVIANGADSVAVIHALMAAPDPGERARQFLEVLGE
jgi:thiamine-phosphate pyrophosphorylase